MGTKLASALKTLREDWLPSLAFSPFPGEEEREGAGCENPFFDSLRVG